VALNLNTLLDAPDPGGPESRVVRFLSERGATAAGELARETGLARSTISMALAELRRHQIVVESANVFSRGVGRPASTFALNPDAGTCIGLHLSLDSVHVVLADVSHSVICEKTIPLGLDYSPHSAVVAVRREMAQICATQRLDPMGFLGVGIAFSGPVAPDGRIQRASIIPTWAGVNIRDVFADLFDGPIFADNESNCAALAEMTWGVAVGCNDFLLFKIDIGVGGAIVSHGRVMTGVAGAAGEFGHMTLDPHGGLCRCGNRGCLELTASLNPAIAAASQLFGRAIDLPEFIALAIEGHPGCRRMIADTAEIAGRGLGMIGAVLNPGLIVVAGRGALAGPLLMNPLMESYERHTLIRRNDVPENQCVRFERGRFTANDSVMGAVALVLGRRRRLA
jgi:predicted NBD/HSP70 family sugar kinase